jgi:hypothetical protein
MERRADLTGADKAVSEVLDEINVRMHGFASGGSYHREFLDWLADRGYRVALTAPAPGPGYKRIADAIELACEAADVDVELRTTEIDAYRRGGGGKLIPDRYLRLARILDKAGLIDWCAFVPQPTGEDTDRG